MIQIHFSCVVYEQEVDVLTKTESTTDKVAESAGTKDPHCAMRTAQPTLLRYVDLPPMLGPVIRWREEEVERLTSLGM